MAYDYERSESKIVTRSHQAYEKEKEKENEENHSPSCQQVNS